MRTFDVTVAIDVPAYTRVRIEALSAMHANAEVCDRLVLRELQRLQYLS